MQIQGKWVRPFLNSDFLSTVINQRCIQTKVMTHHLFNELLVKLNWNEIQAACIFFTIWTEQWSSVKFYDSHIIWSESISTTKSCRDEYHPYTARAFTADNIFILALSTVRRAIMSYYASSAIKILGVQTLNTRVTSHALTTHWRSAQTSQLVYQTRERGKEKGDGE